MLNILSYNVFLRNRIIFKDVQIERANNISKYINKFELKTDEKIDVIILQEVFDKKSRNILLEKLNKLGFIHHSRLLGDTICNRKFKLENGGVMILSRYPIVKERQIIFKESTDGDKLAAKGCVYINIINKEFENIHIFGTHLQSGRSSSENSVQSNIRKNQMVEISKFIKEQNIDKEELIIFGGDINSNLRKEHSKKLLKIINADIPKIVKNFDISIDNTIDSEKNDLVSRVSGSKNTNKQYIDGIFKINNESNYNINGIDALQIESDDYSFLKKIIYRSILIPGLSFYELGICKYSESTKQLSDHYPVISKFTRNNENLYI